MDEFNNNIPQETEVPKTDAPPTQIPKEEKTSVPYGVNPAGAPQGNPAFGTTPPVMPRAPYDAPKPVQPQPIYTAPVRPQPQAQEQPRFNPNINYNPTANTTPVSPQPKKEKNTGKYVFIALVCICIIAAAVVVGLGLSDNGAGVIEPDGNKTNAVDNQAAEAVVEDSPISYSQYSGKGKMTAEQVYKEVKDINVGVIVYYQNQKAGEGSGIVVGESKDKKYTYIITAAHVIATEGASIQVQFNDESEVAATVVGLDEKTDIGVLRIKKTGLKAATFGNSSKLSVGQTIYAIGNPGGTEFFGSFTSGTISAIDRPVPTTNSSYDLPCIQHNAAINPGNSGGALVNEYGQVIGLNSSKISSTEYEGMGFAVPGETMLEIYDQIVEHGYVTNRPMLGITYYAVSSDYQTSMIAYKNGLPYGSVVIATLSNSSDLVNHGIKAGDIITAVNGKKLETTDVLLEAIENGKVGDKLTLTVVRIGSTGEIETTFDAKIKLVEDTGDNAAPQPTQEQPTQNPYSSYFENFGY